MRRYSAWTKGETPMDDAGAGCGMDDESVAGEGAVRSRKALYDAACKRVLSNKIILAWILKGLLAEFESCPVETIADSCIEGDPLVGGAGESGDIGASHNLGVGTAPLIAGMGQGAPLASGDVLFDILFRAKAPGDGDWRGPVDLIINVESQHDFHPGYPLASRACYYCARLLASQHGVEFANSRYGASRRSTPSGCAPIRPSSGGGPPTGTTCASTSSLRVPPACPGATTTSSAWPCCIWAARTPGSGPG